jgi:hypothetical protein
MQFTIIPALLAVALLTNACSITMKMSDITGIPPKPAKPAERVLARVPVPGPEVNGKPVRLPLGVPIDPDLIDQRRTIRPEAQVEALRRATNMDGLIASNAVAVVGDAVVFGRLEPSTQTARTQPDPTEDATLPLDVNKKENKR